MFLLVSVCFDTAQDLVFLLLSECFDTAQALVFLLVSVCCDVAHALVFLLVSVCCDTAQALMFLRVSMCFDTAQAKANPRSSWKWPQMPQNMYGSSLSSSHDVKTQLLTHESQLIPFVTVLQNPF